MKNTKINLSVVLLSMGLATIAAAQEPIQEQIHKIQQWQKESLAFMAGHHARLGAASFVSYLPQYVAKDIVELIKPKEEYGFIKNCTDKSIAIFGLEEVQEPRVMLSVSTDILRRATLDPAHQICFIAQGYEGKREIVRYNGTLSIKTCWISGVTDRLFDVCFQFADEHLVRRASKVLCSELMNFKVYKEGEHIKLEVTSPKHEPAIYYTEQIKPWF